MRRCNSINKIENKTVIYSYYQYILFTKVNITSFDINSMAQISSDLSLNVSADTGIVSTCKVKVNQSDQDTKLTDCDHIDDPVEFTTKLLPITTKENRIEIFNILSSIYDPRFTPPGYNDSMKWAMSAYTEQKSFEKYAKVARVYTSSSAPNIIIQRLVTEREPVNIGMRRFFNESVMNKTFGYNVSYYKRFYNVTNNIAPNIGVYTLAPVSLNGKQQDVHFYHAIGYAFDSEAQPDYKVLSTVNSSIMIQKYINLFKCMFECARHLGLTRIIMPIIGGGSFSALYRDGRDAFQTDIFIPALMSCIENYPDIIIAYTTCDKNCPAALYLKNKKIKYVGKFPIFLNNDWFDNKTTLVGNAWDCHSILGNGNKGDNSMDGWVGRFSAIQFFGLGITNPYLLNNIFRIQ